MRAQERRSDSDLPAADWLLVHLNYGRDGARSLGELAEALNLTRRQVEKAAQSLATRFPVVACEHGIYLGTADEVTAYAEALRRRLVTQYQRIRALRGLARRMRGYQQIGMGL